MISSILVLIQIVKDKHVVIPISSRVRLDLIAIFPDSLAPASVKFVLLDHIVRTTMLLEGVLLFHVVNITIVQRVIFMIISMNKGSRVHQGRTKQKAAFTLLLNVIHVQ